MFYYTQHGGMKPPHHVHLDVPSDYMYTPQYVSYVKKKKGTNITILKRGKNIMKCELQISYTNIVSEDLCSLSNSINPLKTSNF